MSKKLSLSVRLLWASAFLLDITSGMTGLSHKIALFLPAVYLSLSFIQFNGLVIGYRVFHHVCVVGLAGYYLLGLLTSTGEVFDSSYVVAHMAYSWFSGLAIAYLAFCLMLLVVYAPYAVYQRMQSKSPG